MQDSDVHYFKEVPQILLSGNDKYSYTAVAIHKTLKEIVPAIFS